jgi:hypothetical protein
MRQALDGIEAEARGLLEQVRAGVHQNIPLIIANPPGSVLPILKEIRREAHDGIPQLKGIDRGNYADRIRVASSRFYGVLAHTDALEGVVSGRSNPPMRGGVLIPRGGQLDGAPVLFARVIGREMVELRYRHAQDGKLYRHPFEQPATLFGITRGEGQRGLMILSRSPLWDDFDVRR